MKDINIRDWRQELTIATYVARVYGPEGDSPGEVDIMLEFTIANEEDADEFDVSVGDPIYRWVERDSGGQYDTGEPSADREAVIEDGEEIAFDRDETSDADAIIAQIVETGYFGGATAEEIRAICAAATDYSQGYLLLPAGEFCGYPIGRMWTTNGYLDGEYIRLDATHSCVEIAAETLLREILNEEEAE